VPPDTSGQQPERSHRLDQLRVLGADHDDTLTTRNHIAAGTGETGEGERAIELFQQLLRDQLRVLGPDHPAALTSRNNIAGLTGSTGHPHAALELLHQLRPDRVRVLGPDHLDTRDTRHLNDLIRRNPR